MHRLADCSSFNSPTSFAAVDGVLLKATEGLSWNDYTLGPKVDLARKAGKPWGAYHFGRPATGDPVGQARTFYKAVTLVGQPTFRLVLDHEVSDGLSPAQTALFARTFLAELEQLAQHTPIVYSYDSFARAGNCAGLGKYPLWWARYLPGSSWASITASLAGTPWSSMVLWQAGQTSIPGIGSKIDTNYTPDLTPLLPMEAPMPLTNDDVLTILTYPVHVGWSKDPVSVAGLLSAAAGAAHAPATPAPTVDVDALATALAAHLPTTAGAPVDVNAIATAVVASIRAQWSKP